MTEAVVELNVKDVVAELRGGSNWLSGKHGVYSYRHVPKIAACVLEALDGFTVTALIEQLRNAHDWKREGFGHFKDVTMAANDAPFRAAELLGQVAGIAELLAANKAMSARIEEIEKQEPVAAVQHFCGSPSIVWSDRKIADLPHNTHLFAAPVIANQEPAHWRAVLSASQQHLNLVPNIAGFTTFKAAEQFCTEKKDFGGWDYTLEPLFAAPVVSPDVEKLISERDYHLANAKQVYSECSALKAEIQSLKAELADALDCKRGNGPTALSMVIAERDALKAELEAARKDAERWNTMSALMFLGNVECTQDVDGGYRIELDPAENMLGVSWQGNSPEEAIEQAKGAV